MKFEKLKHLSLVLSVLITSGLASCTKDYNSSGITAGTGAPTITSVHTLSKTDTLTTPTSVTQIDGSGNVTTTTGGLPIVPVGFDSVTTSGQKNNYYVIYGTNLGSTTNITFNGIVAYFNRAFITDKSLIVSIPTTTPTVGPAATNKIVVTTLHGSVSYAFVVLTPVPTTQAVSDYDFWNGSQITLMGFGFATVQSVALVTSGTTNVIGAATVLPGQTDATISLSFPQVTAPRVNLAITYVYDSKGDTRTAYTTQEFVDLDNAYTIFASNSFQNSWGDNSWSGPSGASTNAAHAYNGTASAEASYPTNGWKIEGWANWYPSFPYDPTYKYLTFWVKGGTQDQTLTLVGDQMAGGYGQNTSPAVLQQIDVPPGVWTYYKIPLGYSGASQLNYWGASAASAAGSIVAKQLGFFLKGQGSDPNETMYFDEVAFVK